jgi:isopentenyldiphosphate isomerase
MIEKFDLIDLNDKVIGETNREICNQNGDLHRMVAIFVFNQKGELYLQEHQRLHMIDHSVGGHIVKGEDYDAAAKREGAEELGLNCPLTKISKFFSDKVPNGENIRHMFSLYECHPSKDWKFIPNDEVKDIFPMEIEKVVEWMNTEPKKFTPGFLHTMKEYVSQKKLPFKITHDY